MSQEATPRQVLYALVAGGFMVVVVVLTIGAASASLVPAWWSVTLAFAIVLASIWIAFNWRRTAQVLLIAIGVFLLWMVGTLLLAS